MASSKIQVVSSFTTFDSEKELDPKDLSLIKMARHALIGAYAPYSKFKVGAAVLLENGEIITGSNQENAAYPSGLCAERVAIFHASSKFPDIAIKSIAVSCKSSGYTTGWLTPCGACRQAIAEYENRSQQKIRIFMEGDDNKVLLAEGIESLLPFMFTSKQLG